MDTTRLQQLGKDLTALALDLEAAEKGDVNEVLIDIDNTVEEIVKLIKE